MASTIEIQNEIEQANSWEELDRIISGLERETFGDRLYELCKKYKTTPAKLQLECSVSKSMFYDILSDQRTPSKETVLKLAFALKVAVEEVNELLKLAKKKELYPKNKEDAVILFGLQNEKDIYEIQKLLQEKGSKLQLTEG